MATPNPTLTASPPKAKAKAAATAQTRRTAGARVLIVRFCACPTSVGSLGSRLPPLLLLLPLLGMRMRIRTPAAAGGTTTAAAGSTSAGTSSWTSAGTWTSTSTWSWSSIRSRGIAMWGILILIYLILTMQPGTFSLAGRGSDMGTAGTRRRVSSVVVRSSCSRVRARRSTSGCARWARGRYLCRPLTSTARRSLTMRLIIRYRCRWSLSEGGVCVCACSTNVCIDVGGIPYCTVVVEYLIRLR
ncbi:hypothetical protein C8F04DRAFT_102707 [Mycena alexandri]|uniref:Uncharacterized protein n=1 Tax=Mycena alexandri TaxID=1745969 RepID=A0AAD6SGM6_9AGAR|nr:hypothetical protein C8F04DRAFT_102707 [Mycena alexandri]